MYRVLIHERVSLRHLRKFEGFQIIDVGIGVSGFELFGRCQLITENDFHFMFDYLCDVLYPNLQASVDQSVVYYCTRSSAG